MLYGIARQSRETYLLDQAEKSTKPGPQQEGRFQTTLTLPFSK
jgi:hypothetical protein